jgi:hypothetical protein
MGLFSTKNKTTKTNNNYDQRVINDMSGSTFDHSSNDSSYHDSSRIDESYTDKSDNSNYDSSRTDNSYSDSSRTDNSSAYHDFSRIDNGYSDSSLADNSYNDASSSVDDNSYNDASSSVDDNSYNDASSNDNSYSDASSNDNSYSDSSSNDHSYNDASYTDNGFNDSSQLFEDNSYIDSSVDGVNAGNSGSIQIIDGGAFEMAQNAVSDVLSFGRDSLAFGKSSLDSVNNAINQNTIVSGNALAQMGKTAELSMYKAQATNELMRDTATTALQEMSFVVDDIKEQSIETVQVSANANQNALAATVGANNKALEATQKLMTTISANGNDLLIDGVVSVVKWLGLGVGVVGVSFVAVSALRGQK